VLAELLVDRIRLRVALGHIEPNCSASAIHTEELRVDRVTPGSSSKRAG
jgi:hypothetical protein